MSSTYGEHLKVTIDGTSHGPSVKVSVEGIPEGTVIDYRELDEFLRRSSQGGYVGIYHREKRAR